MIGATLRIGGRDAARAARIHGARAALAAGLLALSGFVGVSAIGAGGPSVAVAGDEPSPPTSIGPTSEPQPQAPGPGAGWTPIDPNGDIVAFDACAASISVVYDPDGAPYAAQTDIIDAAALLQEAMGRPVVFAGQDPEPDRRRPDTIIISWVASPAALADADSSTVGQGGPTVILGHRIITAEVTLVTSADLATGLGPASWGSALLHELGHAVGLGHVRDPQQQMFPTISNTRPAEWGRGDLAGLRELSPPCE